MIQLPAVFSSHMVLQRQKNISVWGDSDAESLKITLADKSVSVVPEQGRFQAILPPFEAGGPYTLTVQSQTEQVGYEDVMIGEVWLAGGQSNMELELQDSKNGKEIVQNIHNDGVRYYYTPKVPYVGDKLEEAEKESAWDLCKPDKAGRWSAVAYYFADKIARETGVTVGIIGCNWGGTSASCWVSREALEGTQEIKEYIDDYDAIIENYDNLIVREDCPEFDAVIRFGRWPVSKRLTTAIQNLAPTQIVVDPFEMRDFTSSTSAFITMEPSDFVASLLAEASIAKQATHEDTASGQVATPYIQEWDILNKQETQRILGAKTNPDSSFEGSYVSALIGALPAHSLLFSANSMAIRAIDTFYVKQPKRFAVLANRGLNGIDGTLSTAFGAAQAFNQTVCLTGDLTLFHDLNSLALQHEMDIRAAEGYTRPSIVVVVMNNSGGAIFDMLPQKQDNPYFERIFLTPQNLDFESAAKTFSIPYKRASSVEQFEKALDCFMGCAGIHLIEIKLPLQGVRERYGAFQ